MKAYKVLNAQGAVIWETNNLPAAYRRAERIGGAVSFNHEANKPAHFVGMASDGYTIYSGVQL